MMIACWKRTSCGLVCYPCPLRAWFCTDSRPLEAGPHTSHTSFRHDYDSDATFAVLQQRNHEIVTHRQAMEYAQYFTVLVHTPIPHITVPLLSCVTYSRHNLT
jgi:hypothetical protein